MPGERIRWPYLPFFVYGTLRRGMALDDAIQWAAEETEPAVLPRFALYAMAAPYIGPPPPGTDSSRVYGEVVTVRRDSFQAVLRHLDGIESYQPGPPDFRAGYIRAVLPVLPTTRSEPAPEFPVGIGRPWVAAYVYLGSPAAPYETEFLIPSGDYVAYRREEAERFATRPSRARENSRA